MSSANTAAAAAPSTGAGRARSATELPVRPGEDPWTEAEVEELRSELLGEVDRLKAALAESEEDLADLMNDYGGGAGDDSADTGGKVLEREQELTLTANQQTLLQQSERALEQLESGSFGYCESCGQPIGKMRVQAFPRATLCVPCKQKQERR